MKSTSIAAAIGLFSAANALPKHGEYNGGHQGEKHGGGHAAPSGINDGVILNYALTLEHLEDTFYRTALQNFSMQDFNDAGYDSTFYNNIKEVAYDERTHVAFLTGALKAAGVTPVQECTYSFGVTSVDSFVATAAVLEGVGVSAYLGAAASIASKAYLTAAGSILTVESRHSAYLRSGLQQSPFPQPFDTPLDFNEVYTLAAPFITSCPKGSPSLPLMAFPALSLKNAGPVMMDETITLVSAKKIKSEPLYACFVTVTGPICSSVKVEKDGMSVMTKVPAGVHGQSYVVLSTCSTEISDEYTIAGPALLEVSGTAGGN